MAPHLPRSPSSLKPVSGGAAPPAHAGLSGGPRLYSFTTLGRARAPPRSVRSFVTSTPWPDDLLRWPKLEQRSRLGSEKAKGGERQRLRGLLGRAGPLTCHVCESGGHKRGKGLSLLALSPRLGRSVWPGLTLDWLTGRVWVCARVFCVAWRSRSSRVGTPGPSLAHAPPARSPQGPGSSLAHPQAARARSRLGG